MCASRAYTTLVIMAAGMGSRYGGSKQIDPIGPNGEILMDYSIYDALYCGIKEVVIIVNEDIRPILSQHLQSKFKDRVSIKYVVQSCDMLPEMFDCPKGRIKPWGTGHALYCAREYIKGSFIVINADDFYGRESFSIACQFLGDEAAKDEFGLVGFALKNTLSENGSVSRGVCNIDSNNYLKGINEYVNILFNSNTNNITGDDINGRSDIINMDKIVSMNMWAMSSVLFKHLHDDFIDFLNHNINSPSSEFYLPETINNMIESSKVRVRVLKTNSKWFGITYLQDKINTKESIYNLIHKGVYPEDIKA
ncbi:MAG: NDP-sugar synthase [Hyphomicrobiales bacterium]